MGRQRVSRREAESNPLAAVLGPRRNASAGTGGVGKRRGVDDYEANTPTGPVSASKRKSKTSRIVDSGSDKFTDVRITGWKEHPTYAINYLRRKTRIMIEHTRIDDGVVIAQVRQSDAPALVRKSGLKHDGCTLHISMAGDIEMTPIAVVEATKESTIEVLKKYLFSKYDVSSKLLDLSRMKEDPILKDFGVFASTSTASRMFPALMKVAAEQACPEALSIDLADNGLANLAGITTLTQHFPNLLNLSLANNKLSRWKDFSAWKSKLWKLRELVLVGNPLSANEDEVLREVTKYFKNVTIVNGKEISRSGFDVQDVTAKIPIATIQNFYENPEIQQIAVNFLGRFFPLYDSDRKALVLMYSPSGQFSVTINTSAPRKEMQKDLAWDRYIPLSRNFAKLRREDERKTRLHQGHKQIAEALAHLPVVKHDTSDASKFSVDALHIDGGVPSKRNIMIVVHGEFLELVERPNQSRSANQGRTGNGPGGSEMKRSFDRTFIVSQLEGGNWVIMHDLFTVRGWAGSSAWQEDDATKKLELLRSQTGLNLPYAKLCLEQNGNNLEAAVAAFTKLKVQPHFGRHANRSLRAPYLPKRSRRKP